MSSEVTFPRNKIKTKSCGCCSTSNRVSSGCDADCSSDKCLRWHQKTPQSNSQEWDYNNSSGTPTEQYATCQGHYDTNGHYQANGHYHYDPQQYANYARNAGGGNGQNDHEYAGYYYENAPIDWQRPARSRIIRKCTNCSNGVWRKTEKHPHNGNY